MKRFLVLFHVFIAAFSEAGAFPAVGDHVEFEAGYRGKKILIEKSIKSHDQVQDRFGVRTLVRSDDSILRDEFHWLPRNFLFTPDKIERVLATCVSREGALGRERIQGRTIEVCEFYHEDSQLTTILGRVPFGQVRFQEYLGDGEFLDFWLVRFQGG